MTAKVFLSHQIQALAKSYDLTVVANLQGQTGFADWLPKSVKLVDIPIRREINLIYDVKALFLLIFFFYRSNFLLVHSVSPKAGLLAMMASWIIRVPIRLHTFTGQVWVTKRGIARFILSSLDKMTSKFTTKTLVDSHSQRSFLIEKGIVDEQNSIVLGNGSISGVDLKRFKHDSIIRKSIRHDLGANNSTTILLFLGRLKKEKGVLELVDAFSKLSDNYKNTVLWLVGPDEEELQPKLENIEGVRLVSFTNVPEHYMAAADIFVLPSYREGFGSVVIEAAACGIPTVGTNVYGLSDAIVNGKTGLLVEPRSAVELENAMQKLIENKKLRENMGKKAQIRASELFSQDYVTDQVVMLYRGLLETNKAKV